MFVCLPPSMAVHSDGITIATGQMHGKKPENWVNIQSYCFMESSFKRNCNIKFKIFLHNSLFAHIDAYY